MNTTLDYKTLIMNKSQFETFNTGCIDEINKCVSGCKNFQLDVANSIVSRFRIGLIILCVLVLYQLYVNYNKPLYSQSEFYKKYIDYRLDYAILVLSIALIVMSFF